MQTAWFDTFDYSNEIGQLADDMEEMLGAGHLVILSRELGPTVLKGDARLDPPWRGEVGEAFSTARDALDRLFPTSSHQGWASGVCRIWSEEDPDLIILGHGPGRRFFEPPTPYREAYEAARRQAEVWGMPVDLVCEEVRRLLVVRAAGEALEGMGKPLATSPWHLPASEGPDVPGDHRQADQHTQRSSTTRSRQAEAVRSEHEPKGEVPAQLPGKNPGDRGPARLSVKDVAARLEVSEATVYGLVSRGELRCYRVGNGRGVIRIGEEHLAEFLRASESVPATVETTLPRVRLKHLRLP